MQTEVPEEHSDVVGGSIAARRINCPRSYALEKMVPKDPGNAYAREGTALHEMIAQVLDHDKEPADLLPFKFTRTDHPVEGTWSVVITQDIWDDLGQPALDAFDVFVAEIEESEGAVFEYVVEKRCAMPGIPGAFGTSDVIWKCGKLSGVWDWKFGRNFVSAIENEQLMFYARAAVADFPAMFDGGMDPNREVVLSIMQPQCDDVPDEYIVTISELEAFREELVEAVDEAIRDGVEARVQKGKWCQYATCKAVCPLHAGAAVALGQKLAELYPDGKPDEDPTFGSVLPELLDLADSVSEWLGAIRSAAQSALEGGAEIEGWRLGVSTTNRRGWAVDEEEVLKFLKNRRYKLDEVAPRKVITMPAAEKLLKKDGRVVPDDMIETAVSEKIALVREGSKLPSPTTDPARLAALGGKLKALTGDKT